MSAKLRSGPSLRKVLGRNPRTHPLINVAATLLPAHGALQRHAGDAGGGHVPAGLMKKGQDHADTHHRDAEGLKVRAWSRFYYSVIILRGIRGGGSGRSLEAGKRMVGEWEGECSCHQLKSHNKCVHRKN